MLGLPIRDWLAGLDETEAVDLARELALIEATRLRLPLTVTGFEMSLRITERDKGIDGRTQFPEDADTLLPRGPQVWQVKSGARNPSAAEELAKSGVQEAFDAGFDYVLFWTHDPGDARRRTIQEAFRQESAKAGRVSTILFLESIERLCRNHPAVLAKSQGLPIQALVEVGIWSREFEAIPFFADSNRQALIEAIQNHARSLVASDFALHLYGDTGVGKSRVVLEALQTEGIAERTLVAPTIRALNLALLSWIARTPEAHLVLVVDDVSPQEIDELRKYAGYGLGRVRLITISDRRDRLTLPDSMNLEVKPLAPGAVEQLLAQYEGLGDSEAEIVANFTQGYPALAVRLARAMRRAGPGAEIPALIRSEDLSRLLDEMLPGEDERLNLGHLALFDLLGFDDEAAVETSLVCTAFGLNETQFRLHVELEKGKFVSQAGRYRRVTPRLFAIWLAQQVFRPDPSHVTTALSGLPPSALEAFARQMQNFAGDALIIGVLREVLATEPFRTTDPTLDQGVARFLEVAAYVDPESGLESISSTLGAVTPETLASHSDSLRPIESALSYLVWFRKTFFPSMDLLLTISRAEGVVSNEASGTLSRVFQVYLGGTEVNYSDRIEWARRALRSYRFEPSTAEIVIEAVGHGLQKWESRYSGNAPGRLQVQEWRPSTVSDETATRRMAWQLLIEVAKEEPSLADQVAASIGPGIRTALHRGLTADVLADLPQVDWSAAARAKLAEAVSAALIYDHPESSETLRGLVIRLQGETLRDRIDFVLSASPWDLTKDQQEQLEGSPKVLLDVARDLSGSESSEIEWTALRALEGVQHTAYLLFRHLARAAPDRHIDVYELLLAMDPTPDMPLVGFIAGTFEAGLEPQVDLWLGQWIEQRSLARLLPQAVSVIRANDDRAELAIQAVTTGLATAADLGPLAFGRWSRPLEAGTVLKLALQLTSAPHWRSTENALTLLHSWIEEHPDQVSEELQRGSVQVVRRAIEHQKEHHGTMLNYYVEALIPLLGLTFSEKMKLLLDSLQTQSFPDQPQLEALRQLAEQDPDETLEGVLDLISHAAEEKAPPTWLLWVQDARLITTLENLLSPEVVIQRVLTKPVGLWPALLDHVDFSGDELDPVAKSMIEATTDDRVWEQARTRFLYPGVVVSGPYYRWLEERKTLAHRWAAQSASESVKRWASSLISPLDRWIEQDRTRDAELNA